MAARRTTEQKGLPRRTKRLLAIVLAAVTILGCSFFAYAWLVQTDRTIDHKVAITDLGVSGTVYFVKGTGPDNTLTLEALKNEKPYQTPGGTSMISVSFDKSADNYIGNLRLVAKVKGGSPAYLRVKILEEWTLDDTFIASVLTPYTIAQTPSQIFGVRDENWFTRLFPSWGQKNNLALLPEGDPNHAWYDNRVADFCFYYRTPIYPQDLESSVDMLLINGITDDNFDTMMNTSDNTQLNLIIEAQVVQPNRYREFFNLERLPWEPETPAP